MKKILVWVLAAVVAAGAVVGCVFGIRSCNKNAAKDDNDNSVYSEILYVKEGGEYAGNLVVGAYAFSDTAYTNMTYSIDNGAKTAITVTAGTDATKSSYYSAAYKGKKYIQANPFLIDISALGNTDHTIKLFVSVTTDGKTIEQQIGKTITFNVKNAESAAA